MTGGAYEKANATCSDKPVPDCDYERGKCLPLIGSAGPIDINFGSSYRGVVATNRIVLFAVYRTACLSLIKARRYDSRKVLV